MQQLSGNKLFCLFMGVCTTIYHRPSLAEKPGLNVIYHWTQLEFDYPNPQDRQLDIDKGIFIPGIPAPIDVDIFYSNQVRDRVFLTIPRFQEGIPIALGTVSDKKLNGNPIIVPYPDWSWHTNPTLCGPNRIVSVYRIQIDECGRLWVLDTGRYLEEQTCPPQILLFNLKNDHLIRKFEIPSNLLESRSILVTPTIDIRESQCDEAFVYIADCQTYSIIIYDYYRNTAWKATDKTLYPYPNFGTFNILGDSFDLMDGVLGMALSPYHKNEDRKLFYHAMSSQTENWVYTSHLRNQSRFINHSESSPEIFHTFKHTRNSQSAAQAVDRNGILFYGTMSDTAINCWNSNYEFSTKSTEIILQNPITLQFPSGLKVITNRKGEQELWILTSRFQKIASGTLKSNEINFRIQGGKIDDLIFGTRCKNQLSNNRKIGYGRTSYLFT